MVNLFYKLIEFFTGGLIKISFDKSMFYGVWFGNSEADEFFISKDGMKTAKTKIMFRREYLNDNETTVDFKLAYSDGRTSEDHQPGTWTLKGNVQSDKLVSEGFPMNENYKILKLTKDFIRYQSVDTKTIYVKYRATKELEERWSNFFSLAQKQRELGSEREL